MTGRPESATKKVAMIGGGIEGLRPQRVGHHGDGQSVVEIACLRSTVELRSDRS